MPEVAGDAALLVNPFSVEEITSAMESLFTNENLRNDLISKGKERATHFQWEKSEKALWEMITRHN